MTKLSVTGLQDELRSVVLERRVPFLGVCLGMQLLFEGSEEGSLPGLGFLSGNVVRFGGPLVLAGTIADTPYGVECRKANRERSVV
ncbi:Imidazole glycerol phosphate synthase subunit HisH [Castellaniella defragrans]